MIMSAEGLHNILQGTAVRVESRSRKVKTGNRITVRLVDFLVIVTRWFYNAGACMWQQRIPLAGGWNLTRTLCLNWSRERSTDGFKQHHGGQGAVPNGKDFHLPWACFSLPMAVWDWSCYKWISSQTEFTLWLRLMSFGRGVSRIIFLGGGR